MVYGFYMYRSLVLLTTRIMWPPVSRSPGYIIRICYIKTLTYVMLGMKIPQQNMLYCLMNIKHVLAYLKLTDTA